MNLKARGFTGFTSLTLLLRDCNIPDQSFRNGNGMIRKYGSGNRNSGLNFQNIFRNCSILETGSCSGNRKNSASHSGIRKKSASHSGNWKNSETRSGNWNNSRTRSGNRKISGTRSGNRKNSGTNTFRKPENFPEHVPETGKFP